MDGIYIPEEGLFFFGTFKPENEASARQMAEARFMIVKPFGVNLQQVAPSPLKWERVDGWSVWGTEQGDE